MKGFFEFLKENEVPLFEEEGVHWMPDNLHNFLFHLSGPSDPTKGKVAINEVTLINTVNKSSHAPTHAASGLPMTSEFDHLPKTKKIVDIGHREMPNENLHKRIGAGFHKAFSEMSTEDEKTTAAKHKDSQKVWNEFSQKRGLKTGPKMLGGNLKTEKSTGEGVLTKGLSLAPHTAHGLNHFNVCPNASTECKKNCLGLTAGGNKQYPDTALSSKVLRTHFIAQHPEHAARIIDHELKAHVKSAKKKGMIPGVRMNITSDISWEKHAPQMFERHKDAQLYDYTKLHNRVGHPDLPANYHLTLSHTGANHAESNDRHAVHHLEKGHVVAMVYHRGKNVPNPTHVEDVKTGKRYPVTNGDDDDNTSDRHATAGLTHGQTGHGVVSGLRLKGVKNEDAGHFANKVDHDGIIRINKD